MIFYLASNIGVQSKGDFKCSNGLDVIELSQIFEMCQIYLGGVHKQRWQACGMGGGISQMSTLVNEGGIKGLSTLTKFELFIRLNNLITKKLYLFLNMVQDFLTKLYKKYYKQEVQFSVRNWVLWKIKTQFKNL